MENDETEILEEAFHPDSKYIFPITLFNGKKRKANPDWFKERDWLHYDKIKDRIFCFVCRNAMERKILITKKFETSLVSEGFKDWQDALRAFRSHEKSQIHLEAVEKKMQQGGKNISDMFTHGTLKQKEKEENFQNLVKIFKVLRHLTRQGQAIRGRTDGESNFIQTLNLLADYNVELKEWLEKKSLRFISPIIQNEICQMMANKILSKVTENVRKSNFFAMMVDETRDAANKEQMVFCVRHKDENFEIREVFIGLYELQNTKGDHLEFAVDDIMKMNHFDLACCRGQNYDGASSMRGKKSGLKSRILEKEDRALYVWCFAHNCNLAACEAMKEVQLLKNVMSTTPEIVKCIKYSPKRDAWLDRIKEEVCSQV